MRALAILCALCACGDHIAAGPGVDAGTDAGLAGQGTPARGALAVNEVAPQGEGPDWLELVNRSGEAIDLCDYFVTDQLDRLDHYLALGGAAPPDPCEPRLLSPGGYLVIYADDADDPDEIGPEHAPFELGAADEAHVVDSAGAAVDSVFYLYPADGGGDTLARAPDAEGLFYLAPPTPGEANAEARP